MIIPQPQQDEAKGILDERGRAIEQVKRLYSVVMGFAITQMIGNLYLVAQSAGYDYSTELPFLLAQGLSFGSLISLYYLGAERMLEKRYLSADSPPPTRTGLLTDYVTLAIQAFMFVMLANTVPDLRGPAPSGFASLADWRIGSEQSYQLRFVYILITMTLVDCSFLLLQLYRLRREAQPDTTVLSRAWASVKTFDSLWRKASRDAISAHRVWLNLNLATIVVLAFAVSSWNSNVVGSEVNALSVVMLLTYGVRFALDFGLTFRFYYPPDPLPA